MSRRNIINLRNRANNEARNVRRAAEAKAADAEAKAAAAEAKAAAKAAAKTTTTKGKKK